MCVEVMDLASYVVTKCTIEEHPVTNLHLQKMLYFMQYVYAEQTNGKLLFNDEFEAWQYGPVMPSVYKKYEDFGGMPIEVVSERKPKMSEKLNIFIDAGIKVLREKSPWDLVRLSHAPGSPWSQVYKNGSGNHHTISNDLIVEAAISSKTAA